MLKLNIKFRSKKKRKSISRRYRSKNNINNDSKANFWQRLLILILLILFVLTIYFVAKSVYIFTNLDNLKNNQTTWEGKSKINILLVGFDDKENGYRFADSIVVVSVDPQKYDIVIFAVDPDINVLTQDGSYIELRKLYNFSINGQKGMENISTEVEDLLALKIDKFIALNETNFLNVQPLIGSFHIFIPEDIFDDQIPDFYLKSGNRKLSGELALNLLRSNDQGKNMQLEIQSRAVSNYIQSSLSILRILRNINALRYFETNLSKAEIINLAKVIYKVTPDNIRVAYTKEDSLYIDSKGKKHSKIDRIDKNISDVFFDVDLIKEQARLEVLNGTTSSNLAGKYSRYFSNVGVRVVRTGNSLQPSEKTILFVGEGKMDSYINTINYISLIFDDNIEIVEQEYKYKHIGDLVLVLGENSR